MPLLNLVMRALPVALLVGIGAANAAQTNFASNSPNPFAAGNRLVGTDSCVTSGPLNGICTTGNSTVFTSSSFTFPGDGNQHITVDAILSGKLSNGLGPYALSGVYHFTLLGRTSTAELGSFSLVEDFVSLAGTVFGMPVQLVQDPDIPSTGFATIARFNCTGCDDRYSIGVGLTVNALFVIGGGAPAPVSSVLTGAGAAVPEASTWAMMLLGFGLAGSALRLSARGAVKYGNLRHEVAAAC